MSVTDTPSFTSAQATALLNDSGVILDQPDTRDLVPNLNIARYTENVAGWSYYTSTSSLVTKTGHTRTAIVNGRKVHLSRITSSAAGATLECRFNSVPITPLIAGKKYLLSFYAYADVDQWFWMRTLANTSDYGHGPKWLRAGLLHRFWTLVVATGTAGAASGAVDLGNGPTTALGSGTAAHPVLMSQVSQISQDMWIGGIQIEAAPDNYKDGIALIGDSTMAGASGKKDLPKDFTDKTNIEVSTVLSSLLNVPIFNRAVGGERLDDMDARWATDMTPLNVRSKYAIIQGGINDISQGRTLSQMQASMSSMVAKATTDGLDYRVLNITPTNVISADPVKEALRQSFNAWLSTTYGGKMIDIASVVADPNSVSLLRTEYWGDGVHYVGIAKESVAYKIFQAANFAFTTPTAYRKVSA